MSMELSVDEKIHAAVQPLLVRLSALEAENQQFKTEMATLQKVVHSGPPKHGSGKVINDHGERQPNGKGSKK